MPTSECATSNKIKSFLLTIRLRIKLHTNYIFVFLCVCAVFPIAIINTKIALPGHCSIFVQKMHFLIHMRHQSLLKLCLKVKFGSWDRWDREIKQMKLRFYKILKNISFKTFKY